MEISCSIDGCRSRGYGDNENVLFFPMPFNDLPKLNKWLAAINDDDFIPAIDTYICSKHFTIKDFIIRDNSEPRLKTRAVPSVFNRSVKKEETITITHETDEGHTENDKHIFVQIPNSLELSKNTFHLTLVPSTNNEINTRILNVKNGLHDFEKKPTQEEEEKLKKKMKVMQSYLKMQDLEITRLKELIGSK